MICLVLSTLSITSWPNSLPRTAPAACHGQGLFWAKAASGDGMFRKRDSSEK
jgi:hypothetical protein